MVRSRHLLAAALLGALAAGSALAAGEDVRSLDRKFRDVAARAIPATVLVKSTLSDGSGRAGFGSGATISPDGYILTCAHVVDMAGEVEVTLSSGETYPARVLGKNPKQDYALLKVELEGMASFKIGDDRRLGLGDWVIALGHPGGPYPDLKPAFSVGRVTGLHRRLPVQMLDRYYDDAIRTDAPIFAGNSGGPLISLEGELVGLNGAILLINENSYAVPMHEIAPNLERLKKGENIDGRSPKDGGGGQLMPMDEFEGKDLAKFLGRAGHRLFGKEGLGKLIPGTGPEHDQIARMLDGIGKSLEGENAQHTLQSLLDAFGGGNGGDGKGPDLGDMQKRIQDMLGGDGKGPDLGDMQKRIQDMLGGDGKGPDLGDMQKRIEEMLGGGGGDGKGNPSRGLKDLFDKLGGDKGEPDAAEPATPGVFLGVVPDATSSNVSGVRVGDVLHPSPAEAAGIRVGDVIVGLGGSRVFDIDGVVAALGRRAPGDVILVKILRPRVVADVPVYDERTLEAKLVAREGGK